MKAKKGTIVPAPKAKFIEAIAAAKNRLQGSVRHGNPADVEQEETDPLLRYRDPSRALVSELPAKAVGGAAPAVKAAAENGDAAPGVAVVVSAVEATTWKVVMAPTVKAAMGDGAAAPATTASAAEKVAAPTEESAVEEALITDAPPSSPKSSGSTLASEGLDELTKEINGLKAILEVPSLGKEQLLEVLSRLRAKGCLPTNVLNDTLVGKTVNTLAKNQSMFKEVRASARELVVEWRNMFRKRTAPNSGGDVAKLARSSYTPVLENQLVKATA